jgi:glucan phosphoethanolaminetransferase (alkaline phosphatase superfamily)
VSSAVLYVSDHGEDIYDDEREAFLHASPIPSLFQLHVPLLVWTSAEYNRAYPQKQKNLMKHTDMEVSTNLAVFHSLLDLAGITTSYKKDRHALSHEDYEPNKLRTYLNDHNKPVPISQLYK